VTGRVDSEYEDSSPSSAVVVASPLRDTQEIPLDERSWPAHEVDDESNLRTIRDLLEPPPPERVPKVLVTLSREVRVEQQDEEIVHSFVAGIRDLFSSVTVTRSPSCTRWGVSWRAPVTP
jgi:hypothetical protein